MEEMKIEEQTLNRNKILEEAAKVTTGKASIILIYHMMSLILLAFYNVSSCTLTLPPITSIPFLHSAPLFSFFQVVLNDYEAEKKKSSFLKMIQPKKKTYIVEPNEDYNLKCTASHQSELLLGQLKVGWMTTTSLALSSLSIL